MFSAKKDKKKFRKSSNDATDAESETADSAQAEPQETAAKVEQVAETRKPV